jgi:hypothetical protein
MSKRSLWWKGALLLVVGTAFQFGVGGGSCLSAVVQRILVDTQFR